MPVLSPLSGTVFEIVYNMLQRAESHACDQGIAAKRTVYQSRPDGSQDNACSKALADLRLATTPPEVHLLVQRCESPAICSSDSVPDTLDRPVVSRVRSSCSIIRVRLSSLTAAQTTLMLLLQR